MELHIIPFVDLKYTFALFRVREANMYLTVAEWHRESPEGPKFKSRLWMLYGNAIIWRNLLRIIFLICIIMTCNYIDNIFYRGILSSFFVWLFVNVSVFLLLLPKLEVHSNFFGRSTKNNSDSMF